MNAEEARTLMAANQEPLSAETIKTLARIDDKIKDAAGAGEAWVRFTTLPGEERAVRTSLKSNGFDFTTQPWHSGQQDALVVFQVSWA